MFVGSGFRHVGDANKKGPLNVALFCWSLPEAWLAEYRSGGGVPNEGTLTLAAGMGLKDAVSRRIPDTRAPAGAEGPKLKASAGQ